MADKDFSDIQDAIHKMEVNLRKEVGDLALKVEKVSGSNEILRSRLDSELKHLRREVGEALDKLDEQNTISTRVAVLEQKEDSRTNKDKKRDAGVLAIGGVVGAGVIQFVYDYFKRG